MADLVLLDADPLRDIKNTTKINTVFVRGEPINPARRHRMLTEIEARAQQPKSPATAPAAVRGCPC